MEKIYSSSRAQWAYEETQGIRVKAVEPTPEVEHTEPEIEQVTLDTVVLYEASGPDGIEVFKFAFDKERLANFLTHYVTYLDADGRQQLRNALGESSSVILPTPGVNVRELRLVPDPE